MLSRTEMLERSEQMLMDYAEHIGVGADVEMGVEACYDFIRVLDAVRFVAMQALQDSGDAVGFFCAPTVQEDTDA